MKTIVNDENISLLLTVVNPNTTEQEIKKIITDTDYDWTIMYHALRNPSLSEKFLEDLVPFCDTYSLISNLVRHPNTTDGLLLRLISDHHNTGPSFISTVAARNLKSEVNKRLALMIIRSCRTVN